MVRKPSAGMVAARPRSAESSSRTLWQRGSSSAARVRDTYTDTDLSPARSLAVSSAEKPYRGLIRRARRGMSWFGLSTTRRRDSMVCISAAAKKPPLTVARAGIPRRFSSWAYTWACLLALLRSIVKSPKAMGRSESPSLTVKPPSISSFIRLAIYAASAVSAGAFPREIKTASVSQPSLGP